MTQKQRDIKRKLAARTSTARSSVRSSPTSSSPASSSSPPTTSTWPRSSPSGRSSPTSTVPTAGWADSRRYEVLKEKMTSWRPGLAWSGRSQCGWIDGRCYYRRCRSQHCLARRHLVAPLLAQSSQHESHEPRVPDEIPLPHPPRLLAETKSPLQTRSLHPHRGSSHRPCNHVEGTANPQHEGHSKAVQVLRHPVLLEWARHTYKENLRMCPPYCAYYCGIVDLEVAVVYTGYLKPRMRCRCITSRRLRDSWPRTQEVHRIGSRCGQGQESVKQVRSGHSPRQPLAKQPGRPHDRLSIRADNCATGGDSTESGIVVELEHDVRIDEQTLSRLT